MEITTQRHAHLTTLLGFLSMILVWGSFPVVAKIGTEHAPPLLFSSTRFLLAFCLMIPIVLIQRKKLWITFKQHRQICVVSLFLVGIPASLFFASVPYAPVSVLVLMWATTPIFTAIFNVNGVGEAHGWRLLASLVVGSIGILIVLLGHVPFWPGDTGSPLAFASSGLALVGELAVLGSSVIYGMGMRMAKHVSTEITVSVFTTWQVFYSGVFVALMSLLFEHGYPLQPTWTGFSALLYLVVFCSCIGFFLTFWLIRRIGAIRTAYSDFIIPGVTLVLSYIFLGESITLAKVGGFVLVMLGCVLVEM